MNHYKWQSYFTEFLALAGFVLVAGLLTIFLEHPDLSVMHGYLKDHPILRRIPLGVAMGIYIAIVIQLCGKKSGAQINPSATWTLFRLNKINFIDAVFFTVAQFAGATAAAIILKVSTGKYFGHPLINYGSWQPKPDHPAVGAFVAEFFMSFVFMYVGLRLTSSRRFEKHTALINGSLILIYVVIELPFSGMSLNPARSFAASVVSQQWQYLWIYFFSPPLAMLSAAEFFIAWKNRNSKIVKADVLSSNAKIVVDDFIEIPHYPVKGK